MKCSYNISEMGRRRIAHIDCTGCGNLGSVSDRVCLRNTMDLVCGGQVDEIRFNKGGYAEIYGREQVGILQEIGDTIKQIQQDEPWTDIGRCNRGHDDWKKFIRDACKQAYYKPTEVYDMLVSLRKQYDKPHVKAKFKPACVRSYIEVIDKMIGKLEGTVVIRRYLKGDELWDLFSPVIQPAFISSSIEWRIPEGARLKDIYSVSDADIRIYDLDGVNRLYFVNLPEMWLSPGDVDIMNKVAEIVSEEHILDIISPAEARTYFKRTGYDLIMDLDRKYGFNLRKADVEKLSEVFARYTAGYGVLEILFRDANIFDIYVDSPPGVTPVYIDHRDYGICTTNLSLSEEDLEKISSKFRSIGGRPFDEANPVMDMELRELGIRVAGIREPSSFGGIAYAFRKHKETPWTLAKFVDEDMMSARSAALLGLLVGGRRSILVTGARGSGKTSLLSALIAEIRQDDRIVLMEDTPEISVDYLRRCGWKIEHLRNRPPISTTKAGQSYELSPQENLRAALRLGESVLILGEVRGTEARALFEAMRVGAAGNAVLGTIHGSTPYDTWDRVTNDLGVPSTSFKAVDIVVSLGYREVDAGSRKERYLRNITEVGKIWDSNPEREGAFVDIMSYDEASNVEVFHVESSAVVKDIAMQKKMSPAECEDSILFREKMIKSMVELSHKEKLGELLELKGTVNANRIYLRLMNDQVRRYGRVDYDMLYSGWRKEFLDYVNGIKP